MKHINNFKLFLEARAIYGNLISDEEGQIPCAVYNADKKELIGLFNSRTLASKYIFGDRTKSGKITDAIRRTGAMKASSNPMNIRIACRNLTPKQKELLGTEPFLIFGDYKKPDIGFIR